MPHRVIKCGNCGERLDEADAARDIPCPNCNSTIRRFELGFEEHLHLSTRLIAEHRSEHRTVGVRDTGDARSAFAEDHRDGRISMKLIGTPSQGEEDTPEVCRILIQTINQGGKRWNSPQQGTQDVDCFAESVVDPKSPRLEIQVVRANESQDFWHTMAKAGQIAMSHTALDEICDQMTKALQSKMIIPPRQHAGLVLALDATRLPAFTLDSVVERFRQRHKAVLEASGFASVWLVGPTESLTRRLDQ